MKTIEETYDVVVCGGGLAGVSAAVASARHGARTCLVQDRPVLGGNSSSEIRVTPHGAAAFHAYARETGIVSEALTAERAANHEPIMENGWTNSVWDLTLYDLVTRTRGLTVHLNTTVEEVRSEGQEIREVVARVANAETVLRLRAREFIDCTGDGTVGDLAGARSMSGTEARSEFNEPHAPEEPSEEVMGSSLHFKTIDVGHPVPFAAPEWAVRYDDPSFFYEGGRVPKTLRSGYWWIEIGPPWDTLHDNEALRHELTRHVLGIWDYIKNRDPQLKDRARNLALDWVGQVPGKRETRRLIGRSILTENDLIGRAVFDDEIAYGGWYVDLHTLGGLLAENSEPLNARHLDPTTEYAVKTYVGPFGIPLGILVSRDVSNLLMAGRDVSATHAALGSIRVMSTCALMGQAAGTAAAVAICHGVGLESARRDHIAEIQQILLRDGCFLPNGRNADPLDLARSASVSASSQELLRGTGPFSPSRLADLGQWTDHPVYPYSGVLERRCAQWIALGTRPRLDAIEVCLSNSTPAPRLIRARLFVVEGIWDYRVDPGDPVAQTVLEAPPGGPQWVRWDLGGGVDPSSLPAKGYVRVDLDADPDVEWHVSEDVVPANLAAYEAQPGRYRRFAGGASLSFRVEPPQDCFSPENVISGVTRPSGSTNLWRSDPAEPLPQWLQLEWPAPQTIAQIQLTFEGQLLREYHAYPPFYRDPQVSADYEIHVRRSGRWVPVSAARRNFATRVVHDLAEPVSADALRVVVQATNGDASAGIFEVRCYADAVCAPTPFGPAASQVPVSE